MKSKLLLLVTLAAGLFAGCEKEGPKKVERITMRGSLTLEVSDKATFTAVVLPTDAVDGKLSWVVEDTSIATYNPDTQEVTAVGVGSTTLTASAGNKQSKCTVTVVPFSGDVVSLISDPVFKAYCESQMSKWDTNKNGRLGYPEAAAVTELEITGMSGEYSVAKTEWTKYFTGVTALTFSGNQFTLLDLSGCDKLQNLSFADNTSPVSLNVSGCIYLTYLEIKNSAIASLDVSENKSLKQLTLRNNTGLTSVDASGCTLLTSVDCQENPLLTSVDVSNCTLLTRLNCAYNAVTKLDVSGCTALLHLYCGSNALTTLDVSGCTALSNLDCYKNALTALDVSTCAMLSSLGCTYNLLTGIDISKNQKLTYFSCTNNPGNGTKFSVRAWFDNTGIPHKFDPTVSGYGFETDIYYNDKPISVDYQKVI